MGKITGFLEYPRKNYYYKPVEERINNFDEFMILNCEDELKRQGARCMDCGIPYCHTLGCPINNLIPEWNDLVYNGFWKEAYQRLSLTNDFPEFTGRLCPAPCETSCTLSINTEPVTIKQIELSIIEKAFEEGWVVPKPPENLTNKKVAIIGSGPSGLAAANQLRRMGHDVVVFEKSNKIGGILRYGIPDFKLNKSIIDRRLEIMKKEGVKFEPNVLVGEDISIKYLRKNFDAILLTIGAGKPRDLLVPGRNFENIFFAMQYLTNVNKYIAKEISEYELISAKGKNVLVVGGGDTGADCVGTAIRQGAKTVYNFEILPQPKVWKNPWNPDWPNWPNILRTSSSHEEGCIRDWCVSVKSFSGIDINVSKANCVRVNWKLDPVTKKYTMEEIPGSDFSVDVDLVLLAMGFLHVENDQLLKELDLKYDQKGNILVDCNYSTSVKGVFAAGDAISGPSLIVRAINHGRRVANCINEFLKNV